MMRSGNAETRIASCRATRALAARRGDLSRRKIGISAFVEALWALVAPTRAPDLLHVDVSAEVAESNNTDDPGAEPDSEANPETPGDQSAETNSGESHEKKHGRPLPVDPRSRHHALRALITMCSTSWRACDLVVARAGAVTCAELVATKSPAVLIPSPNVAEDHQTKNAVALKEIGVAEVLPEAELSGGNALYTMVTTLLTDPDRLTQMSSAAAAKDTPNAAEEIAEDVARLAKR